MNNSGDVAEQIRQLRIETTAAVEQCDLLAANVCRALIDAVNEGLICRDGADDALAGWGLEPLPGLWTVSGEAYVSYMWMHVDEAEARERAEWLVFSGVRVGSRARMRATSVRVTNVIAVNGEKSASYRITARVGLRTQVTAISSAEAYRWAEVVLQAQQPQLTRDGFALRDWKWTDVESPHLAHAAAGRGARPTAAATTGLADPHGDLATVSAAHARAANDLARLRRRIRARAIIALAHDEVASDQGDATDQVDRFLVGLGLDGLPRAHHTTVTADLVLRVRADSSIQARTRVWYAMRAASGAHHARRFTDSGWCPSPPVDLGGGCWQVPWQHTIEVWFRGYTSAAAALAAAGTGACRTGHRIGRPAP